MQVNPVKDFSGSFFSGCGKQRGIGDHNLGKRKSRMSCWRHFEYICIYTCLSMCFLPIYSGRQTTCGRTSRGHTGGRSRRIISPPSSCGACLIFSRENDSAAPFPRRPWSRVLCTRERIVTPLAGHYYCLLFTYCEGKSLLVWLHRDSNSCLNIRRFQVYQLNHRGDRLLYLHTYSVLYSSLSIYIYCWNHFELAGHLYITYSCL